MSGADGIRVLLVEDARATREMIARALEEAGCAVHAVSTCAAASAALEALAFRAVVLDLGLPDGNGVDLCRRWRRDGKAVPILILTARADVASRVAGLDAGADDYLTKPFALAELRARLRALLRRTPGEVRDRTYRRGDVLIDFSRRLVLRGGAEIPITRRELEVLARLARASGHAVSRDALLDEIWGEVTEKAAASLEVIVARLRRKLDAPGSEKLVRTIRGHGYALERGDGGTA
ncbi:MAG: response regulator transcription factor [Acidobacteria bacterium]|nr:response regulator transcription factor [Acidobacteriota bacterium]